MGLPFNIFDTLPRDCWVEIDAGQLAANIRHLQKHIDRPVLVAIKANGYGHGYENAAKTFLNGGASYLGVANYAEGYIIRQLGITTPVLILNGMPVSEMAVAAEAGLEFFVFRPDHINALRQISQSRKVRVHIKIDSGMGRLGCFPEDAAEIAKALRAMPNVTIAGLATHFAKASIPDNPHTNSQITRFEQAIAALADLGIRPEIIHAANSSGALYHPKARYDMVRLGIVAYGVPPSSVVGPDIPAGVKTALEWKAKITSSKILPKGSTVSYGCEYEMPKEARIGIVPVGYADGFHRIPKNINSVLIDGQERKILGRVNMDQCMVDLGGMPDMTGAEVVLLGKQGDKEISVHELAMRWDNTNTYSVYTDIASRVPRRVVK